MRDYSSIDMEWVWPEGYDHENASELYWIIVFPRGDRTKLSVASMCDGTSYEESDYDIASRKRFRDEQMAATYCRELAKQNGLQCDGIEINILD